MAKFTKPFRGVPAGEIHPVDYAVGDECPAELLEAAKGEGAIDGKGDKPAKPARDAAAAAD